MPGDEDCNRLVRALAIAFVGVRKNRGECFRGGILQRAHGCGRAFGREGARQLGRWRTMPMATTRSQAKATFTST